MDDKLKFLFTIRFGGVMILHVSNSSLAGLLLGDDMIIPVFSFMTDIYLSLFQYPLASKNGLEKRGIEWAYVFQDILVGCS